MTATDRAMAREEWDRIRELEAENATLRAALDKSAHALAIAGVWIVAPDRNARIRRAEREALDALTAAPAIDEEGRTDA